MNKNKKKEHLIVSPENYKSNKQIADEVLNSGLLSDCIEYQFLKLVKTDPWKSTFKEDMFQDLYLILLDYDIAKLNDAYWNNHMNALMTRIIQNNIYSNSSIFFHRYIKFPYKSNEMKDIQGGLEV